MRLFHHLGCIIVGAACDEEAVSFAYCSSNVSQRVNSNSSMVTSTRQHYSLSIAALSSCLTIAQIVTSLMQDPWCAHTSTKGRRTLD